jgi:hypothetical protein
MPHWLTNTRHTTELKERASSPHVRRCKCTGSAASRDVELSSWDLPDKSAGTNLQLRPQGEPVLCVKKEKEIFLTTYPKCGIV